MKRQQQQQPQQCDFNDLLVLKLREADDFGASAQAAIRAGEGSAQVHDLSCSTSLFVNAFGEDWFHLDEAYLSRRRE